MLEPQAWTKPDARITTAAASLSLNQLKHILFTAYSSAENFGSISVECSVDLSSGSGQRVLVLACGIGCELPGCRFLMISFDFRHSQLFSIQREPTTYEKPAIPFQELSATSTSDTAGKFVSLLECRRFISPVMFQIKFHIR